MTEQLIARRVGYLIRAAREAAGLSQLELGCRIGRGQTAISYWEGGKRQINVADLVRLAAEMNVPAASLLPGASARGTAHERAVAALIGAWPYLADDLVYAEQLAHVVLGSLDLSKEASHG